MLETVGAGGRYGIDISTDRDEWNAFVKRNDGPAYVHRGWSEAVASYGHDSWHLAARREDTGAIAAVLPLYHVKSRLFGSQLLSPAFAERGSIVPDEEADTTLATRLLLEQTKRLAEKRNVDVVSLRGSPIGSTDGGRNGDGTVEDDDFTLENQYVTFRIPLCGGPEAVRSSVKDSRQRQIDQAAENPALQFRVGTSISDLEDYYQCYLETMRGHGSPPHSFEFFRILWEQLRDDGHLRLGMITHDGSLINGMIDLSMGSTVYQWGVVSDYEHRDLNGGSLLLWKSLEWAAENGYDTYECGRTREGSGVYMFKKSFGGSKTWYDDLHYFPNEAASLPDPEDSTYERATKVWQRLPLPITRIVGPHIRKRIGL